MNPEINIAFVVLGVGMITVFVILGLVVLSGDILIRVVNRYFPATAIKSPSNDPSVNYSQSSGTQNQKTTVAAIVAAVDLVTGGKGKADKIEKID